MSSSDKDFRFMATNDLVKKLCFYKFKFIRIESYYFDRFKMTELQKDSIKLDDDSERKVVRMLLKLLEDKNGEVQNLAVRW